MESLAVILYLIGSFGAIITYLFTPTIIIYEKDKKKRNLILGFTALLIISLVWENKKRFFQENTL